MPYIKHRGLMDDALNAVLAVVLEPGRTITTGDLNYLITRILAAFIGSPSYARINEMIGVLECVKLELYRRMAVPYEEKKKIDNGDIPEYSG
jgi:hypothetical protein